MATRKELEALERTFQENSLDPEEDEDDEKMRCVLPLFYDSKEEVCAEIAATAAAAAERRRREAEEKAAEHARKVEECTRRNAANQAVRNRIREYDPKTGKVCYTRFYHKDFSRFDIDEECKSKFQFLPIHSSMESMFNLRVYSACLLLQCDTLTQMFTEFSMSCSASASDAVHSHHSIHIHQPKWKTGLQPVGVSKHLLSEDSRFRCSLPARGVWYCDCQRLP
jgi:hypothetical protein